MDSLRERESMSSANSSTEQDRERERLHMLHTQLEGRGIVDSHVLKAMSEVRRETFVMPVMEKDAYADSALPIECGQTISQPYTVAFMAQEARIAEGDKVLEIGTGSGYGAAVLSRLAREVHTIERIPLLAELARERLQLDCANVYVHLGDGTLGLPAQAPFDAIVVTAGAKSLPPSYEEQLNDGGRIIIPLGNTPRSQTMHRFTRIGGKLLLERLGAFAFVPLVGQHGWQE